MFNLCDILYGNLFHYAKPQTDFSPKTELIRLLGEKGIAFAEKTQAGSPVVDRWNDYMQDVLELEMDPETGAQPKMMQMFLLE